MATGLTYDIGEKGDVTFEQYVWRVARQFGGLLHMRDDPSETIPYKRSDSPSEYIRDPYHATQLEKEKAGLYKVSAMTTKEVEVEAARVYEAAAAEYEKSVANRNLQNSRFEAMLVKVKAFKPPLKDHEGLKEMMISQLEMSIDKYAYPKPVRLGGEGWRARIIEMHEDNIQYHTKALAEEERKRGDGPTADEWFDTLEAAVPIPGKKKPIAIYLFNPKTRRSFTRDNEERGGGRRDTTRSKKAKE